MPPDQGQAPARRDFLKQSALLAGGSLASSGMFARLLAEGPTSPGE